MKRVTRTRKARVRRLVAGRHVEVEQTKGVNLYYYEPSLLNELVDKVKKFANSYYTT